MLRNCNFLKIAKRDNFCKTLSPLLHVYIQNLNILFRPDLEWDQTAVGPGSQRLCERLSFFLWLQVLFWAWILLATNFVKLFFFQWMLVSPILAGFDFSLLQFGLVLPWFTDFCLFILSDCYISNEGERHVERSRLHHQLPLCGDHWTSAEGLLWCEKLKYS